MRVACLSHGYRAYGLDRLQSFTDMLRQSFNFQVKANLSRVQDSTAEAPKKEKIVFPLRFFYGDQLTVSRTKKYHCYNGSTNYFSWNFFKYTKDLHG